MIKFVLNPELLSSLGKMLISEKIVTDELEWFMSNEKLKIDYDIRIESNMKVGESSIILSGINIIWMSINYSRYHNIPPINTNKK